MRLCLIAELQQIFGNPMEVYIKHLLRFVKLIAVYLIQCLSLRETFWLALY